VELGSRAKDFVCCKLIQFYLPKENFCCSHLPRPWSV